MANIAELTINQLVRITLQRSLSWDKDAYDYENAKKDSQPIPASYFIIWFNNCCCFFV